MKIEQVFHMKGGCGEASYASNSKLQEKAIIETRPLVEEAIKEIYSTVFPDKFVAADLGCSSSPNAFLVLSEIINSIDEHYRKSNRNKPEVQFFLNDLPSNDFNNIFQLSTLFEKRVIKENGGKPVPFYVVGLPGTFYGRLFPSKSVHFFHSSYSLMWLSQVPEGLEGENCSHLNRGNIYINEESSSIVYNLYLEQFKRDFSVFLESRSKELVFGGRMVLTIIGRKSTPYLGGHLYFWGFISDALNSMLFEGLVEEDKLNAFNMPFYTPLMEEVKSIIETDGSFHLIRAQTFESNWDPFDESTDNFTVDNDISGENVAKYTRAILEPLLASYFGNKIMDDLFSRYAKNVTRHMSKGKPKFLVFILFLKLKDESILT